MSPIKGLTERKRLPRIGKIHLGVRVKKPDGTEYPRPVDYFVFDPEHPQFKELITTYGDKPKELKIIFPVEDTEQFASQWYRLYSRSRGLVCKGNGETAVQMIDTKTHKLANRESKEVENQEIVCKGRDCPNYGRAGCGEVMNLQFLLPEVSGFGVWQIDTGSINSIMNINNALDLVRQIYGRVAMVPLILTLEPKEVTNPDDGKKKTVHIINLRSMDKMIEAYQKSQMPPLALVQGMVEVADEGNLIDGGNVDLPAVGDTAPFIDLPTVRETELETKEQPAPQVTKSLKKPIKESASGNAQVAKSDPIIEQALEIIREIGQKDPLPLQAKPGDKLRVKDTGDVLTWEQIDEKSGRWHKMENPPAKQEAVVTVPEDAPKTAGDFFKWLQTKGRKYGPSWFYKQFPYTEEDMKNPVKVGMAYIEVKKIMMW